jgi:hypothetical protein
MSEERTTDKFGHTGEACRECNTSYKDCTAGIFLEKEGPGKSCCGVCYVTDTHNARVPLTNDECASVTLLLDAATTAKVDRALKIIRAHGDLDTTRESLIMSGAVSLVDGFLFFFDNDADATIN